MLIKITEIDKNAELGSYDATMVTGTRIDNGNEWSKKFFSNNQELTNALDEFGVGETVNIRMAKGKGTDRNGNPNWNIVGFEEASDTLVDSVRGRDTSNPTGSGASGSPGRTGGGTKWSGRTGEAYDRSASIYLAFEFLKYNKPLGNTKDTHKMIAEVELFTLANKINNYIHNGDDGSDALSPPEI